MIGNTQGRTFSFGITVMIVAVIASLIVILATVAQTITPTPTIGSTPTVAPTLTTAPTPTVVSTPTTAPTDTPVPTNTPVPTETSTPVATDTPVPTETPTTEPTSTPIAEPTETSTPTATPTVTPTPAMCTLRVCKATDPSGDPTLFTFGISPLDNPIIVGSTKHGGPCLEAVIPKGVSTIVAELVPAGWTLTSIACSTDDVVKSGNSVSFKCNDDFGICTFIDTKDTPTPTPTPTPSPTPDPDKTQICHRRQYNLWNLITVADSALAAHFAHGDFPAGAVPEGEIDTCKNDNSCPLNLGDSINDNKDCDLRIDATQCRCDCEVKTASGEIEERVCKSKCNLKSCAYDITKYNMNTPCGTVNYPNCQCIVETVETHNTPKLVRISCNSGQVSCAGTTTCQPALGETILTGCLDTGGKCECRTQSSKFIGIGFLITPHARPCA